MTTPKAAYPLTPAERRMGVEVLRLGGMSEHIAHVVLDYDAECQDIARRVTPVFERLAESVNKIMARLDADNAASSTSTTEAES